MAFFLPLSKPLVITKKTPKNKNFAGVKDEERSRCSAVGLNPLLCVELPNSQGWAGVGGVWGVIKTVEGVQ